LFFLLCISHRGLVVFRLLHEALAVTRSDGHEEGGQTQCQQFKQQFLGNRSFVVLITVVGLFTGAMAGWTSVLQTMLGPEGLSQTLVGWGGFSNNLACNFAGILAGTLIDRCFRRRLKAGILVGVTGLLVSLILFSLSLPCFGVKAPNSILPHADWSLVTFLTLVGFFQGAAEPLFYELGAELMYPAKESTSAGVIVLVTNVVAGIMITFNSYLTAAFMNYIVCSFILIVGLSVLFGVHESYKRPQNSPKAPGVSVRDPVL